MLGALKSSRRKSTVLPADGPHVEAPARPRPQRKHGPVTRRFTRLFERGAPKPDPEVERLENELQEARQVHQDAQQRFETLNDEVQQMEEKIAERERRRKNDELKKLTKELGIAQRFLSTADSLSQAEVVRAMEALNEEIFQLTSICADMINVQEKRSPDGTRRERFHQLLAPHLGPAFLEVVIPLQLEDSLAIQVGWQGILARWCSELIQAWVAEDLGIGGTLNRDMGGIYAGATSQNNQAVGGRWRSLVHEATDDIPAETRQKLVSPALETLLALPMACGYISSQKPYEELRNAFQQRIGPLVDKCLRFRKMVGEEITSTDIRPYLCDSGQMHDPKWADLEYEDEKDGASAQKQGVIACSLGLGLYTFRDPDTKTAESKESILKPKVILQETLKEIIS